MSKRPKEAFMKEDVLMVSKQELLEFRKMQIKMTMRHQYTPSNMNTTRKTWQV